jgi:hypothetical protein
MVESARLRTLANWLAGEFENAQQAREDPVWFVHLRLWHRPLPHRIEGHLAIFAEQANVLKLDQPYRQRLMLLQEKPDTAQLQVRYWAFQRPGDFVGAGANPERLAHLAIADLEPLPGCVLTVTQDGSVFSGKMAAEDRCCFQYQGETRQVVLGFDARESEFASYDRGVDPATGRSLWGALMGPYQFQKQQDWSRQLP